MVSAIIIDEIGNLAAFVVGALVGALLPRYLARKGRIRCKSHVLDSVAVGVSGFIEEKPTLPINTDSFDSAADITFFFDADLFNEKEIPTGLRSVAVAFSTRNGREIEQPVYKRKVHSSSDQFRSSPHEELKTIELPPGRFVHLELLTGFGAKNLPDKDKREMIFQSEQASLVGEFPDGRKYRKHIHFPESFPGVFREA